MFAVRWTSSTATTTSGTSWWLKTCCSVLWRVACVSEKLWETYIKILKNWKNNKEILSKNWHIHDIGMDDGVRPFFAVCPPVKLLYWPGFGGFGSHCLMPMASVLLGTRGRRHKEDIRRQRNGQHKQTKNSRRNSTSFMPALFFRGHLLKLIYNHEGLGCWKAAGHLHTLFAGHRRGLFLGFGHCLWRRLMASDRPVATMVLQIVLMAIH